MDWITSNIVAREKCAWWKFIRNFLIFPLAIKSSSQAQIFMKMQTFFRLKRRSMEIKTNVWSICMITVHLVHSHRALTFLMMIFAFVHLTMKIILGAWTFDVKQECSCRFPLTNEFFYTRRRQIKFSATWNLWFAHDSDWWLTWRRFLSDFFLLLPNVLFHAHNIS